MKEPTLSIMRHLEDVDNLRDSGRDGGLVPGQEEAARQIATELVENVDQEGQQAILFISSDRLRTMQTVDLLRDAIKRLTKGAIKVRHAVQPDLAAMYQGEFVLPADYMPGDFYAPLQFATKAWVEETSGENANLLYRFGDPVKLPDGSWKHAQLAHHFSQYGENSQECLARFYQLALAACDGESRLRGRTKVMIVTHAQLYQIYTSLATVALRLKKGGLVFPVGGGLPAYCWRLYRERWESNGGGRPSFPILHVPVSSLSGGGLARVLGQEIWHLGYITVPNNG
jgi:broad specificity phosphatase PhoE